MKKFLSAILVLLLALCISGCNNTNNDTNSAGKTNKNTQSNTETDTVVVPNVVGMDKDEAVKLLEGMGLEVELKKYHYQKDPDTQDFYPDNYVLEQDTQSGTVMTKNSKIKLTINSNTDKWNYTKNDDGTITITSISVIRTPDDITHIPAEYEGFVVSKVSANIINFEGERSKLLYDNKINVIIPKTVEIEGTTEYNNYIFE